MNILIVKMGSTLEDLAEARGDFEDWIRAGLCVASGKVRVLDAQGDEPLPDPRSLAGAVLTGSHAMVTERLAWSERTAAWLPTVVAAGVPVLGICYGHQLLAHALGGRVGPTPGGREFGTTEIVLHETAHTDRLFSSLPARMSAHVSHAQSALELPPGAVCLAASARDAHHAFRIGTSAWGVQFHPEFDETAALAYVDHYSDGLRSDGFDPAAVMRSIRQTPDAAKLLSRFGHIAE